MSVEPKSVGNAFERRVVEREDVVVKAVEALRTMVGVHSIHAFKLPNPRGALDPISAIGHQAAIREWVAREGLVIRRTEEMRIGSVEGHDDDRVVGAVSPETDVSDLEIAIRGRESWHRRSGVTRGQVAQLDDLVFAIDLVHTERVFDLQADGRSAGRVSAYALRRRRAAAVE